MTDDERVIADHVAGDPLRHACLVFDLANAHRGAGTRHLDPLLVDRHRDDVLDVVGAIGASLMETAADPPIPARSVGVRDAARERVVTAIARLVHHTHLGMVENGLAEGHAGTGLFVGRALFAAAIADEALDAIERAHPEAVADHRRRSIAA